ncbi:hypothetical protein E4S40_09215 [Algoriphagus kandeliae]|uniref:DUF6265 domain-containing protein n=1 Tax=Algoriphagus kandeliae TaxID=2562278 RepID=A0A4Y9QQZ8_9BACT|nr:DUF6265 family protein [Algoriphagus kandeliae]TFV94208.1 hypothetical protein E4S40_09215 [Algoriphagus kandeliae]
MKIFFSFLLCLSINHFSFAQVRSLAEGENPGKGALENLDWLVGYWLGTGFGGECEEVWMPAVDGHMIGTFRFWENGKLVFSEFMNLVQDGESVTMKLKHFSPDLEGWEEKEEWTVFKLIELGDEKVWFDGMTIERKGEQLIYHLNVSDGADTKTEILNFSKKAH